MVDLSLALGLPLADLRRMPLRDVRAYQMRLHRIGSPARRLEVAVAKAGQVLAQVLGQVTLPLTAFLPDPPDDDADADDASATGGGNADWDEFFGCPPVLPPASQAPTNPLTHH